MTNKFDVKRVELVTKLGAVQGVQLTEAFFGNTYDTVREHAFPTILFDTVRQNVMQSIDVGDRHYMRMGYIGDWLIITSDNEVTVMEDTIVQRYLRML